MLDFTLRRLTNVQFPYAFYLLGAGAGAALFVAPPQIFFEEAPAPDFF